MKSENLHPAEIPSYIQNLQANNFALLSKVKELEPKVIAFEKFYNVAVTTAEVANYHGYHEATIRKYVHLKLIPTHPKSTNAKILIRLSDALQLDFDLLRKQSQQL